MIGTRIHNLELEVILELLAIDTTYYQFISDVMRKILELGIIDLYDDVYVML